MKPDKPHILYLDDEKENLDGFYFSFFDFYDISLASTPKQAEELLADINFEVLIVDQKMPEMSGIDFIKKIKPQYPEIIFIIITAYASLNDAIQAVNEANVYRFLSKPWNNDYIKCTVDEAVETYRLKQNHKILIEELKKQNIKLEKAYKKAKVSDMLKSHFLKNLSHEIRTPLNGIMGFSELLINNIEEDHQLKRFAELIYESGEQLLTIFEDIIAMSLIQTDAVQVNNYEFIPSKIIDEIIKKYDSKLKKASLKLVYNINKSTTQVVISDGDKIQKILNNLLDNAIKFTPKGSITISCDVENNHNKNMLVFNISDTGRGIAKKNLNRIFEPFIQLDPAQSELVSGNGVGLTICKVYAEKLNGHLYVRSEPNIGSEFIFKIPVKLVE